MDKEKDFSNEWVKIIYRNTKTNKIERITSNRGYNEESLKEMALKYNVENDGLRCEIYELKSEVESYLWNFCLSDDNLKNRIESIIDDIENEIVDYTFNLEQKLQELKEIQ